MGVALQTSIPDGPSEQNGSVEGTAAMSAWRFKLAVLQHDRVVYRMARALLRDDREAEDVVQEAFLRYWQLGSGIEHARAWLLKVARNACLDRLRRTNRLVSHEEVEPPEPSEDRDPAWHFQQGELAANLQRLLDRLPEPQRSLIVLFDMHGLDGPACARVLGLSTTQVKVYLHRARRKLRAQLEQQS